MSEKTTVASVKCADYTGAEEAVRRALEHLGGIDRFIQPGMRVLLKPNLLFGASPEKCITTHPAVVEAAVKIVREAGCRPIMGDSPGVGSGSFHAKAAGFRKVCRDTGAEWVDFEDNPVEIEGGKTFKKITVARPVMEADALINLPKIKTHGQTYLTLCVKNMFGIIPGVQKTRWHMHAGRDTVTFSKMLVEICYLKKPALNIADGILAMEGNGPRGGNPFPLGYILAGEDATAVDAVICRMLKVKPEHLPTLTAAEELSLGITDPANIEIFGDNPYLAEVNRFRFCGQHLPSQMGTAGSIANLFRGGLTSRPKIDHELCTRCGQCVNHCPAEAMNLPGEEGDKSVKVAIDLDTCIRCYCCSEICPEGAILVRQGWMWKLIPAALR